MDAKTPALNAGLAKRLAEAVDGLRDGNYYYLVCRSQFPYDLTAIGSISEEEAAVQAENLVEEKNKDFADKIYNKYGPYLTTPEYYPPFDYDQIGISLIKDGEEIYAELHDGDTDAIFFNISAFDKFMLPYYARLYGPDVAAELRARAVKVFSGKSLDLQSNQYAMYALTTGSTSILVTHKNRTYSLGL